jgi:hypothetical protein
MNLRSMVAERLNQLRRLSGPTLKLLPPDSTGMPTPDISLTQYSKPLPNGEHAVVVQVSQKKWLGLSKTREADGFIVAADGTKREMSHRDLAEYR